MDMSTTPTTATTSVISTITTRSRRSLSRHRRWSLSTASFEQFCRIGVVASLWRGGSGAALVPVVRRVPSALCFQLSLTSRFLSNRTICPASLPLTTMVEIRMLPDITRLTQVSRPIASVEMEVVLVRSLTLAAIR